MKDRIDKVLSNGGYGTRRDVKKLMHSSCVCVNGKTITDSSFHVDILNDTITINSEKIIFCKDVYLMMNKCQNVVSANKDGEHETVFDLLEEKYRVGKNLLDLHTVGRLDLDTEGLLLLTTDGELTHKLISPKSHISKTYLVFLRDKMSEKEKTECEKKFKMGIHIEAEDNDKECDCKPSVVEFISSEKALSLTGENAILSDVLSHSSDVIMPEAKSYSDEKMLAKDAAAKNLGDFALLTIYEGKYHQVKRMFSAVKNKVVYLKRLAMGKLYLDKALLSGQYRELTIDEIELLKSDKAKT